MREKFNSKRQMGFAYIPPQEPMEFHLVPEGERIFYLSLGGLRLLLNMKRGSEEEGSISHLSPRGNQSAFVCLCD